MLQMATTANDTDDEDEPYHSAFTFLQIENVQTSDFVFTQAANGHNIIPHTWILLDSQSTISVFRNRDLLTNIRPSKKTLRVHTNGGTQMSNEVGHVQNFGDVWFNTNSLANILSMAKVCRILMDTSVKAAINVHRKDGSIMKFKEYKLGLYYYDTGNPSQEQTNDTRDSHDYLFLNTVANNKAHYTRREIEGADKRLGPYT
jgi:hypothetical protein